MPTPTLVPDSPGVSWTAQRSPQNACASATSTAATAETSRDDLAFFPTFERA
ncbi:MAG: hypothetical protein VKQ33_10420 [Candidatus Sericytochromatia bacterium]|nr:hypothetical protein [Candidatus Sericytochromatia bacterium]